jgi:hypothetical protein
MGVTVKPHGKLLWGGVAGWPARPVNLPEGWGAIEVDRLWIRGEPMKLTAKQGEWARLEPQ